MTREPIVCKVTNDSSTDVVLTRDSPTFFARILKVMSCEPKQVFRRMGDVDDMNYVLDVHRRKFHFGPKHVPAIPFASSSDGVKIGSADLNESGIEMIEPSSSPLKLPAVKSPSKPLNLVVKLKRVNSDTPQLVDSPTSPDAKGDGRRQNLKRAKSCTK